MSSPEWIGNAINVQQIVSRTFGGTWAGADTVTVTRNSKSLVVTVGTPVTTADIATLVATAFNASERINDTTGSSNVGGQSVPEFAEIIASVSGSVVTFTNRNSKFYGWPFTITLTKSSTSGTVSSETVVQAATGQNWWNNILNWAAGAVPVDGDTAIFRDSSIDCLFGLPNGSLEIGLRRYNSFTGKIGLPKININNSKPYYEDRQRYVILDDHASGTTITHYMGIGPGNGSGRCNLRHNGLTATFEIDCNGKAAEDNGRVNNIIAPAGGVINIRKGTVNGSSQGGGTAAWSSINIAGRAGSVSDIDVLIDDNATASLTVNQVGGLLSIRQASWTSNGATMRGGELVLNATPPSVNVAEGKLTTIAGGTIAAAVLNPQGVLDASQLTAALTFTNMTRYRDSEVIDPAGRIVHTNPVSLAGARWGDVKNDYGYNRKYQVSS